MMPAAKSCEDYTFEDRHNDYIRHIRQDGKACRASKRAWALHQRRLRHRRRLEAAVYATHNKE